MSTIIEINEDSFRQEVLDSALPVLVDFFSPTCQPCKYMLPVLDALAQELAGQVKVVKVNVLENLALSEAHEISAVPTFAVFNNGREVGRIVGAVSKDRLLTALEEAA